MRIDNQFLADVSVRRPVPVSRPARISSSRPRQSNAGLHASSAELAQLFALAGQEPETRAEVVDRAEDRLARGFYDSGAIAEQTARVMLQAGE